MKSFPFFCSLFLLVNDARGSMCMTCRHGPGADTSGQAHDVWDRYQIGLAPQPKKKTVSKKLQNNFKMRAMFFHFAVLFFRKPRSSRQRCSGDPSAGGLCLTAGINSNNKTEVFSILNNFFLHH